MPHHVCLDYAALNLQPQYVAELIRQRFRNGIDTFTLESVS